jgi:hypothetical protein
MGCAVQTGLNQPVHGFQKWFNLGWLHWLAGLKPDHVKGYLDVQTPQEDWENFLRGVNGFLIKKRQI